jgi:hypothetical protein
MTTFASDIPIGLDIRPPPERRLKDYANFAKAMMSETATNAVAYTTNRVAKATQTAGTLDQKTAADQAAKLSNVLLDATFIPAYPTRFVVGGMGKIEYFIFHRPISRTDKIGGKPVAMDSLGNVLGGSLLSMTRWFAIEGVAACTHFIIGYGGELVQMVDLADRAKHIGEQRSGKVQNSNAVGVEMEGAIEEPMTLPQLEKVAWLVAAMSRIYSFPVDKTHLLLHSKLSPNCRRDPGDHFPLDWVIQKASLFLASGQIPTEKSQLFRTPFDASAVYEQQLVALATSAATASNPAERSMMLSAVAKANAGVRAAGMAQLDRAVLANASVENAVRTGNWQAKDLATKLRVDDLTKMVETTRQTSVDGLCYDYGKNEWNDGKQV